MKKNLWLGALARFLGGLGLVGLMLFLPAGTLRYGRAWLFIALLFIPMLGVGIALLMKSPELLQKRLHMDEQEKTQRWVVGLSVVMFVAGFIAAGLDFRFGWSRVPGWLTVAAAVVQLLSYGLYPEVMRENAYLSRTVEVQSGQKVVDTGLYGVVRHPMYLATVLLCLSIPLVLGSWYAFALFLIYPALIVMRIRNEEAVLEKGLQGYAEYRQKVKYRLIPFIW